MGCNKLAFFVAIILKMQHNLQNVVRKSSHFIIWESIMKKKILLLLLVCFIPLFSACEKTPSGGGYDPLKGTVDETPMEDSTIVDETLEEEPAKFELTEDAYKNLPLIRINIENGGFPTDKENYLNCSFDMTNTANGDYDLSVKMGKAGIRLRGNSTMNMAKHPFRIKFNKKQSLFGLQANKSWVLLADYIDQSGMRNYTAMKIASAVYDDFSPTGTHIVLVINDEYQGVYLLCEQIDEKEGRTNVEATIDPTTQNEFPFLVEMDSATLIDEDDLSTFEFENMWYPMEIKYPKEDERILEEDEDLLTDDEKYDLKKKVYDYIKEYVWASLYTLKNGGSVKVSFSETEVTFEDLVDEDSYLTYVLINEVMGNGDNFWKSIYMYKTSTGKLKFGPIWDFDWAMSGDWTGFPYAEMTDKYAKKFTLINPSNLQGRYLLNESRYNKLVVKFNSIKVKIENVAKELPDYYNLIRTTLSIDATYWYGENGTYMADSQFASVRLYLIDKIDFLSEQFSKSYSQFMGLEQE